jgi:hypothetical protein
MDGGKVRLNSIPNALLTSDEAIQVVRLMLERAGYMDSGELDVPLLLDDALANVIEDAKRTEVLERELGRARERIKDLTQELVEADQLAIDMQHELNGAHGALAEAKKVP